MSFPRLALALVCAVVLGVTAAFSQSATDAGDEYFRGYLLNNEAERLVQSGDLQRALDKFQQAQTIFDSVAKNYPAWQVDMLKFRRDRVATSIGDVQAKLANPPPAPTPPPAPAPAPAPANPATAPGNGGGAAAPMMLGPVAPVQAVPSTGDPIKDAVNNLLQATQSQYQGALAQIGNYSLLAQQMQAQRDEAVRQRDTYYTQAAKLQQSATQQQAKIAELEKQVASGGASKADLDKARKDLSDMQDQLTDAKDRMIKAEKAVMSQSQQLTETTLKITTLEKERDALKEKLQAAETENDKLKKMTVPDDVKALVTQNEQLKKELADARTQITALKADNTNKDQEIASLKGQLTKIQGELTTLRKENAAYESQMAELTLELKKIREQPADPKSKGEQAPQLMAENQLLRGIILRQLLQQARQQQQKTLVIDEIKKTEGVSKELLAQVEQLGADRVTLSEDEQKLFTTPQLQEFMGSGGIKATLVAQSGTKGDAKAGSPTESPDEAKKKEQAELDALISRGNEFLQAGKLTEAAQAYEDVLRTDPKNPTGLAGLAWARVQQGKLDDAEATLKKSLAYDPNNAPAHYMLAVTFFRRDRFTEAMGAFEKSLAIDAKNARARHYLGVISTRIGDNARAEREFKNALAIDPGYGEADFNLAVIFATKTPPDWDNAKKHYKAAQDKGVKPDANLDKLLQGAK